MKRIRMIKPTGSEILAAGSGILFFHIPFFKRSRSTGLGMLCTAACGTSGKKGAPAVTSTGHDIRNIHESCLALLARRNPDQIRRITSGRQYGAVVFVFCIYSSLQFGIFTWYISRLGLCRGKSVANALMISFAWVVAEFFFFRFFFPTE